MASGQRGANGRPGGSVATDGGAPGIGTRLGGAFRHVAAGQFDVHLAGNGEATFTAPTQPGEYAFYCTYHPSMKGTLMVQ
jgi:plastocyanin